MNTTQVCNRTYLAEAFRQGVPQGTAPGHDDRGLVFGLGQEQGVLARGAPIKPGARRGCLTLAHWHGHGDNQGHHTSLSAHKTHLLLLLEENGG